MQTDENSGGDVNYYVVEIKHPKRFEPCTVECEDIIAALGMDFFEGEAFKATWRKAAQRTLGKGKAGNTALRDAQKMAHYGARSMAHEQNRAYDELPAPKPTDPSEWRRGDVLRGLSGKTYSFSHHAAGLTFAEGVLPGLFTAGLSWVRRP